MFGRSNNHVSKRNVYQKNYNNYADINLIFNAFYAVFYVFFNKSKSKLQIFLPNLIEYIITLALSYIVISDLISIYRVFDLLPVGLTFSTLITDICSFSIRVVLLIKKSSILSAMKFIQESYSRLERNYTLRRAKLFIAFSACFIIPVTDIVYASIICIGGKYNYLEYAFFWWSPQDLTAACIMLFCINILTLNQLYALPGFAIVLCCYVFGVLKRFIDEFVSKLQQKNEIQDILAFYIKYSQILFTCIEKIENALSILIVFLYGYMTCSIFSVTTILVRVDYEKTYIVDLIPDFVMILVVVPVFFIMSFRAIAVNDAAVRVQRCIYQLVARIEGKNYPQRNLLLVMAADFPTRIVVTGWGLFSLKRSFIQGIAGAMITYSIILSQLGK